jgi:hypothetical protein
MALAEALQKAAAKRAASAYAHGVSSVAPSNASSSLGAGIAMERERQARLRACDIDAWYERLAPVTFKTRFVPLSSAEAQALIASYWAKRRGQPLPDAELNSGLLATLKGRIAAAMTELAPGAGVFAKLSSRSAKDSRFCEAKALERVKQRLTALRNEGATIDTNAVLTACLACGIQALKLERYDLALSASFFFRSRIRLP